MAPARKPGLGRGRVGNHLRCAILRLIKMTMPANRTGNRRVGSADLPLHDGKVPHWLAARMSRLGAVMAEAIVQHYGRNERTRRLARPSWCQYYRSLMGMVLLHW